MKLILIGQSVYKVTQKQLSEILLRHDKIKTQVGYYNTVEVGETEFNEWLNANISNYKKLGDLSFDVQ